MRAVLLGTKGGPTPSAFRAPAAVAADETWLRGFRKNFAGEAVVGRNLQQV